MMGDSTSDSNSSKNSKMVSIREIGNHVLASPPKANSPKTSNHIHAKLVNGATGEIVFFFLKVASLEIFRRISRSKCPVFWRGLQALQVFCYPPFKWFQKWSPFKSLVTSMQVVSGPLFFLSIATTFSDLLGHCDESSDDVTNYSDSEHSESNPDPCSDSESMNFTLDTRIWNDESSQSLGTENWRLKLYEELENQGISLPERMDEYELHLFYTAAKSDFSCLLSSVKKTVRWRETYNILSHQELEIWSNLVFWHGIDAKHRPSLFVRLGLACSSLPSHDRPRFVQALVSQVENGILHLGDAENPQFTVLLDCEGLSPVRFPMQMARTCFTLLQDHFPNRLGCLFIIRLPPGFRVIAQTFIQDLKPVTREKLKVEREMPPKVVLEYFRTLPSYLGGHCTCATCAIISGRNILHSYAKDNTKISESIAVMTDEDDYLASLQPMYRSDHALRTGMIRSILMFWVLVAVIAGFYDPENRLFVPS